MDSSSRTRWTTNKRLGIFRVADGSFTRFFLHSGLDEAKERVEENLANFKECHSVLGKIARCFVGVPFESLTAKLQLGIHKTSVCTLHIRINRKTKPDSERNVAVSGKSICMDPQEVTGQDRSAVP